MLSLGSAGRNRLLSFPGGVCNVAEKTRHKTGNVNNPRDYESSASLFGNCCRQSTVNYLLNGADHKHRRSSKGGRSPDWRGWEGLNEEICEAGTERVDSRCCYSGLFIYSFIICLQRGSSLGARIVTIFSTPISSGPQIVTGT